MMDSVIFACIPSYDDNSMYQGIMNAIESGYFDIKFQLKLGLPMGRIFHYYVLDPLPPSIQSSVTIGSIELLSENMIGSLCSYIEQISLIPLTFTVKDFEVDPNIDSDINNRTACELNLKLFISDFVSANLDISDNKITIELDTVSGGGGSGGGNIEVRPMISVSTLTDNHTDNYIYVTDEEYSALRSKVCDNLSDYLHVQSLGCDNMIPYVLSMYAPELLGSLEYRDRVYQLRDDKVAGGSSAVPHNTVTGSLLQLRRSIQTISLGLYDQDYFPVRFVTNERHYKEFCMELASMWDIDIIHDSHDTLVMKGNERGTCEFNAFYYMAALNYPFSAVMDGPWQLQMISSEKRAKLSYMASDIVSKDPWLAPFVNLIHVYDDLSIYVPVISKSQYNNVYTQMVNMSGDLGKIYAVPVDDLENAILARYYLALKDDTIRSEILDFDHNIYVVTRYELDPNDLDNFMSEKEKHLADIRSIYLNYLSEICEGTSDPITFDEFKEFSVVDLLQVIRPERDSRYCFSVKTLQKLDKMESPMTRQAFTADVIQIIKDPLVGIRGYLTVPKLFRGLFDVIPQVPSVTVENTLIQVIQDNNSTSVDVHLPGGHIKEIINIEMLISPEDIATIEKLWTEGRFLSIWNRYNISMGKELSVPLFLSGDLGWLGRGPSSSVTNALNIVRQNG